MHAAEVIKAYLTLWRISGCCIQHFPKNGGRQMGCVDNDLCLVALDFMSIEYCCVVLCIIFIFTPLGGRSKLL